MSESPLYLIQKQFCEFIHQATHFKGHASQKIDIDKLNILSNKPISREQRVDIYSSGYRQKMIEMLADDFPKIYSLLSQENAFNNLVADYLLKYPSRSWTLSQLGQNLSGFIEHSSWGHKYEYLSTLAEFEWQLVLCHNVPSSSAFPLELFAQLSSEEHESLVLQYSANVYFFSAPWDLQAEKIVKQDSFYLIYRFGGEVRVRSLTATEWHLSQKIKQGFSLGDLSSELSDADEDVVFQLFSFFVSKNVVCNFKLRG